MVLQVLNAAPMPPPELTSLSLPGKDNKRKRHLYSSFKKTEGGKKDEILVKQNQPKEPLLRDLEGLILLILKREQRNPANERAKAKPNLSRTGFTPFSCPIIVLTINLISLLALKRDKYLITFHHHHHPHPSQTHGKSTRFICGLCLETQQSHR